MKLNATELDLLSSINEYQAARKRTAQSFLGTPVALLAVYWFLGSLPEFLMGALLSVIVLAFMHLLRVYFEIGPEYKLVEMLRKFVNHDPDVIAKLAAHEKATNDEVRAQEVSGR